YSGTVYGEPVEGTGKIGQATPPAAPPGMDAGPVDQTGAPPAPGASGEMPPAGGQPGEAPEEEMSLEEAIEIAPEVIETIVEKVEQGETLLHGQEVAPVEQPGELQPGAPSIGTTPMQEGAMPVISMFAQAEEMSGLRFSPTAKRRILAWLTSENSVRQAQMEGENAPKVPELI